MHHRSSKPRLQQVATPKPIDLPSIKKESSASFESSPKPTKEDKPVPKSWATLTKEKPNQSKVEPWSTWIDDSEMDYSDIPVFEDGIGQQKKEKKDDMERLNKDQKECNTKDEYQQLWEKDQGKTAWKASDQNEWKSKQNEWKAGEPKQWKSRVKDDWKRNRKSGGHSAWKPRDHNKPNENDGKSDKKTNENDWKANENDWKTNENWKADKDEWKTNENDRKTNGNWKEDKNDWGATENDWKIHENDWNQQDNAWKSTKEPTNQWNANQESDWNSKGNQSQNRPKSQRGLWQPPNERSSANHRQANQQSNADQDHWWRSSKESPKPRKKSELKPEDFDSVMDSIKQMMKTKDKEQKTVNKQPEPYVLPIPAHINVANKPNFYANEESEEEIKPIVKESSSRYPGDTMIQDMNWYPVPPLWSPREMPIYQGIPYIPYQGFAQSAYVPQRSTNRRPPRNDIVRTKKVSKQVGSLTVEITSKR